MRCELKKKSVDGMRATSKYCVYNGTCSKVIIFIIKTLPACTETNLVYVNSVNACHS